MKMNFEFNTIMGNGKVEIEMSTAEMAQQMTNLTTIVGMLKDNTLNEIGQSFITAIVNAETSAHDHKVCMRKLREAEEDRLEERAKSRNVDNADYTEVK